jgi:hypothetical protein
MEKFFKDSKIENYSDDELECRYELQKRYVAHLIRIDQSFGDCTIKQETVWADIEKADMYIEMKERGLL